MIGQLAKLPIFTEPNRGARAQYCHAYGLWVEAIEAIQKFGAMMKFPSGYALQSPYIEIAIVSPRYAAHFCGVRAYTGKPISDQN